MSSSEFLSPDAEKNIEENLNSWDRNYAWPEDGDEWRGQAAACDVPYETWKQSLIAHLISPYVTDATVVEIAPGHGRWTEHLVTARELFVVDVSQSCLEYCRRRFRERDNVHYWHTSGTALPPGLTNRVDFVWSYDAFVHMHPDVVARYVEEIARVLKWGGSAIIHHADVADPITHDQSGAPGWRSAVSAVMVRQMAKEAGLFVEDQFVFWDEQYRIGVPNHSDAISHLRHR